MQICVHLPVWGTSDLFVNSYLGPKISSFGILYPVAAWLLLQLTDVLSSLLSVPESAGSVVVLLIVPGLRNDPEGLKHEVDIDRSQSTTPGTGKKVNTVIIVLSILAQPGQLPHQVPIYR